MGFIVEDPKNVYSVIFTRARFISFWMRIFASKPSAKSGASGVIVSDHSNRSIWFFAACHPKYKTTVKRTRSVGGTVLIDNETVVRKR